MQILVLGMHRAGTSVVTRIIHLMGASVGPAHLLLPANPDNPKGFWERRDVLQANAMLIQHFGGTWYKVDTFDEARFSTVPDVITDAIRAIIRELDAHPPWVMKDPRLCITLPFWQPFLRSPLAVIVSRDPLEIAQSLALRNALPIEYGLALWEFYASGIIRNTHAMPKLFIQHEAVMRSLPEQIRLLHQGLQRHGGTGLTLQPANTFTDFIEPSLHRAHARDVKQTLSAHQLALAAMLRGEMAFDASIRPSPEAMQITENMGYSLTGAPANY